MKNISDHIVMVSVSDLKEYKRNNKKHPKDQIDKIKRSIESFGFRNPLLIDSKSEIIAGHGRLKAAMELDMKELPCIVIDDLTEDEVKALRIMDNKSTESEFDFEMLKEEFSSLDTSGFDLDLTGFNFDEISDIMGKKTEIEEDLVEVGAYERAKNKSKIQLGDIFQIGNHRLMCGDSTKDSSLKQLLQDSKIDSLISSLPHKVDQKLENQFLNNLDKGARVQVDIENDSISNYRELFKSFLEIIPFSEYNTIYVSISGKEVLNLGLAFNDVGIYKSCELVWVKNNHVLGRQDYNSKHELVLYGWKGKHKFYGDFSTTVLNFDKPLKSELHPTMKPVALIAKLIQDGTEEGMRVYDAFAGSGPTLLACEQTNRVCFSMELDPVYCQVIIDRMHKYNPQLEIKCLNREFNPLEEK